MPLPGAGPATGRTVKLKTRLECDDDEPISGCTWPGARDNCPEKTKKASKVISAEKRAKSAIKSYKFAMARTLVALFVLSGAIAGALCQHSDKAATATTATTTQVHKTHQVQESAEANKTRAPLASDRRQQDEPSRAVANATTSAPVEKLASSESAPVSALALEPASKKVSPAGGQRWSQHFGARLRPLAQHGAPQDYHGAASSSKSTAQLAPGNGQQLPAQQTGGRQAAGFAAPVLGNNVDSNEDGQEEGDDDDDDSEALLYKMMQQQTFLMNPIFQEQPPTAVATSGGQQVAGSNRAEGRAPSSANDGQQQRRPQQQQQQQQQRQQAEDSASSRKVIKLLKSYSHIHQVDDSDDQIRGTYTRLSSYRPATGQSRQRDGQVSSREQYPGALSAGRRASNGSPSATGRRQHVFISSRPVATSQSRESARAIDGTQAHNVYSAVEHQHGSPSPDGSSGSSADGGNESGGGNEGAPQEEDEFECPNNGIFADVASGCQAYHVCQSGAQVQERFNCPLGTLFNDIILTCDFAHNVQCGKKPGDSAAGGGIAPDANLQVNSAAYNRQSSQHYQQQAAVPREQQQQQQQQFRRPTATYPQPSSSRPAAEGPRQLVIGGSPYNRHNRQQQQASSQAQALGSYPPALKPLSNALSDNDADEDNEVNEPLIPATLPPRLPASSSQLAPTGASAPRLPYKAPPPPPTTETTHAMPTSIQQQIPHQANRQSAHYSQYPAIQSPAQQHQHHQGQTQRQNRYVTEASSPSRSYGTTDASQRAPAPTAVGPPPPPQQQQQQSAQIGGGSENGDNQSFNLVINHLAPGREQRQQPAQQQFVRHDKSREQHKEQQQQAAPLYKSEPMVVNRQQVHRLVAASYPNNQKQQQHHQQQQQQQQQSQRAQSSARPQSAPAFHQQPDQQARVQRQQRQQSSYQSEQRYENQRGAQPQAHNSQGSTAKPVYANEPAATQHSVSHLASEPNVSGLVDLTNGADGSQSGVGSENLNSGLLLIVRHSSGAPTLQVQSGSGAQKPVAYAVDPTLVNPNSPLDSKLFPNVQQFVAEQHQQRTSQASTNRVAHVEPSAQAARSVVPGLLPPMSPPEPVRQHGGQHDGDHQNQDAGEQYGAYEQPAAPGAIVPGASSPVGAKGTLLAAGSDANPAVLQRQHTQQKPPASAKKAEQPARTRRAKSALKPTQAPAKPAKPADKSASVASTSTTTAASTTSTSTAAATGKSTDKAQQHAKSDKRKTTTTTTGQSRGGQK